MKGAAGKLHDWYDLTDYERSVIREELNKRIEQFNAPPDD